jgi:nondiscriminating glutamyl-tRNA synthetase
MSKPMTKTRFAPSPTGFIHMGNARTALFSALLARSQGGAFVLRIEDTDQERSREEFTHALQEDLWWLGLIWQEGPVQGGENGPYHQSERTGLYERYYDELLEKGIAYPCFCSPQELEMSRKAQRAAGRPPRYSGKCARLNPEEVQRRVDEGIKPTLRFRVPDDREIVFEDVVRGRQVFRGAEIGDFIIRRADGSPAFFFSNAVDDSLMGVTHVLRGEDHLTNTPRQMLILEALGLPVPAYGHINMIVGHDGSPLSKRHGSRSLRELREAGYFPGAVSNYLARLGHYFGHDDFKDLDGLAAEFELERLAKSPSKYDAHQLLSWQHQAIEKAGLDTLWDWMGEPVHHLVADEHRDEFIEAIRPNITFPDQALKWAQVLFTDPLNLDDEAREIVAEAGSSFFRAALEAIEEYSDDFKAFANAVKAATGAKGRGLFMPLRVALTGQTGGPEMNRVLPLLTKERARQRLAACVE